MATTSRGLDKPFIPRRVRRIRRTYREQMFRAENSAKLEQWCKSEWEKCARPDINGLLYFTQEYGSIEPPIGEPIPFWLWPAQRPVLKAFLDHEVNVVLKARRLGLSWLALHFAAWLMLFAPLGPGARIILICKNDDDAKKLLSRVKRIFQRLPFWLRPELDPDNVRELGVVSTEATITALPATDRAARQETATLFILDEFAFPKDMAAGGIWTAVLPTIEGGGRGIAISTGNGRAGDGATFAGLWDRTQAPGSSMNGIFLPWWERPGRDKAWYDTQKRNYLRLEDFLPEYPSTPDEALLGSDDPQVYPYSGILAAENLGAVLDAYYKIALMDGVEVGGDWGDFQTNAIYAAPLAGGGVWIADEKVLQRCEPTRASRAILEHEVAGLAPGILSTAFDSAPRGTNRTFADVLRSYHEDQPASYPDTHQIWPFSVVKEGGGEKRGVQTVGYIEMLFTNAAQLWERIADLDGFAQLREIQQTPDLIAISERCKVLRHQLRELRRDETGRIAKPIVSPTDIYAGDHGPDALVALCAGRATAYQAMMAANDTRGG